MRLQLILALLALAPRAFAQEEADGAEASFRLYTDDDRTTVESWSAQAQKTVHGVAINAGAVVDTITSASIDLVTAASPHGFSDTRIAGRLAARGELRPGLRVGGSVLAASERDYASDVVGADVQLDLADKRITLSGRAALELDRVYRADDAMFERSLTVVDGSAGATFVVNRRTLVDVIDEVAIGSGFQASPYRYVRIYSPTDAATMMMVPENDPDSRVRNAALVRLRRALGQRWFVHADYRFYADTWGITSHTVQGQAFVSLLGDRLALGARARGYTQDHANFYRRRYQTYPGVPLLRTADKELAEMRSGLVGTHASWAWRHLRAVEEIRVELYLERLWLEYLDFDPLPSRAAWISGGTLGLAF